MKAVNAEAKDPHGCGIAAVAFTRTATLDTKTVRGKMMQAVRIKVLAGFDGATWERASGMVQYAVIEPAGVDV